MVDLFLVQAERGGRDPDADEPAVELLGRGGRAASPAGVGEPGRQRDQVLAERPRAGGAGVRVGHDAAIGGALHGGGRRHRHLGRRHGRGSSRRSPRRKTRLTGHFGGTGLGPRHLVPAGRGDGWGVVGAERRGQGTRFSFTLEARAWRRPAAAASIGALSEKHLAAVRGLKVLVVEDNAVNQLILSKTLSRLACRTSVAEDGRKALEALAREPLRRGADGRADAGDGRDSGDQGDPRVRARRGRWCRFWR